MTTTLYVNIKGVQIRDITNNVDGTDVLYLGVKYILGKDNIVFTEDENGFLLVTRYRGKVRIYVHKFMEDGDYMLTPLFVTEYKPTTPEYRSIYNFLKKNYNESFMLEVDNNIKEPYQIIFKSWVDMTFNVKFMVTINEKLIKSEHVNEFKVCLLRMKEIDLMELHRRVAGKSIFIDIKSLDVLKGLPNMYVEQAW